MLLLMLYHLLDNAVQHTPDGTPIALSASLENNSVGIAVEDAGPGVSEELLPHLFERFYRGMIPASGRLAQDLVSPLRPP